MHVYMCIPQMQDQQAAVKLMEDSHREAFDADRVKYEEEIASLTRILNGMVCVCACSSPSNASLPPPQSKPQSTRASCRERGKPLRGRRRPSWLTSPPTSFPLPPRCPSPPLTPLPPLHVLHAPPSPWSPACGRLRRSPNYSSPLLSL